MRIVIDMQGAQSTGSRDRGIGRYTLALTKALIRNRGSHEIILALSGNFADTIIPIHSTFESLLPAGCIRIWQSTVPVSYIDEANNWRRNIAELTYESFLASLKPDFVYVTSLFEDLGIDTVTSIHRLLHNTPVAVTVYDLIPYLYQKPYLENPMVEAWYFEKLEHLKKADLWLAISESARQDCINHLDLPDEWTINIGTDADAFFQPVAITADHEMALRTRYGLSKSFILCTGGLDQRKNVEGLIRAFGRLPQPLRSTYQLAIVFSLQPARQDALMRLIKQQGLNEEDVVLTGYVPDEDLLILYNICRLFVFPSWYEGFGLPVLEAMRCGAPVIGANTSSLPEVIGWNEALFDPHSDEALAQAIERGLTDEPFRQALLEHHKKQACKFSWNDSARRVIAAMERKREHWDRTVLLQKPKRPRLAYVSPLQAIRSDIADYSAVLLPELSRFYHIDVVVEQDEVVDPWVKANSSARTSQWFRQNADQYDRVLYHFGNSAFCQQMFQLLEEVPGVVVLHDFFLSEALAHIESNHPDDAAWRKSLYGSHGHIALHDRQHTTELAEVVRKYPCNLSVIQNSLGVITHSADILKLASRWYILDPNGWAVIPSRCDTPQADKGNKECQILRKYNRDTTSQHLGEVETHNRVDQTSLAVRYRDAIEDFYRHAEGHVSLLSKAIAGQQARNFDDIELMSLAAVIARNLPSPCRPWQLLVDITRPMDPGEEYALLPQLIAWLELPPHACRVEPVYFADDGIYYYARNFAAHLLGCEAIFPDEPIEYWSGDVFMRAGLVTESAPLQNIIYEDMLQYGVELRLLPRGDGLLRHEYRVEPELAEILMRLENNNQKISPKNQLFVDISVFLVVDLKTGIQRVVRSILHQLSIQNISWPFRIEPVYAVPGNQGYFYVKHLFAQGRGSSSPSWKDGTISFNAGDVFLCLELNHHVAVDNMDFYQKLRNHGVRVNFIVYDLLPVLLPEFFAQHLRPLHEDWLKVIAQCDGAFCISKTVADELGQWFTERSLLQSNFRIEWFHLGADIDTSVSSKGKPDNAGLLLNRIVKQSTFLMVGTLEPRKGHAQVLASFELLWKKGIQINLVIVGGNGWMMEAFSEKMLKHPEWQNRLFWIDNASDEYLKEIYAASICLIAASEGEGFGLPLIEAAQHNLPIIARDTPVFREVAGDNAFYFLGTDAESLGNVIEQWLELYKKSSIPDPSGISWLTWAQSTEALMTKLLKHQKYGSVTDVEELFPHDR